MANLLDNSKYFQLSVRIIEASQLPIINATTQVYVSVGNQRKRVRAKTKKTQSPYFDETVIFDFHEPFEIFVNRHLRLAVHKLKCDKLIGRCDIELTTIWGQLGHQVSRKSVVLVDPKDPVLNPKGYLKCDIILIEEGVPSYFPEVTISDEIGQNLLVPAGINCRRQNVLFTFNIYRADRVQCRLVRCCRQQFVDCKRLLVKVRLGEKTVLTKVAKGIEPVWNQALTFIEPIPSLFETITIDLWDKSMGVLVGSTTLSFSQLCQQLQIHEMPSFGPAFLYLYQLSRECPTLPHLSGRLLMSLDCDLVNTMNPIKKNPKTKISPLDEKILGPKEPYIIFLAVLQCVFFCKKFFNHCQISVSHGALNTTPGIQLDSKGNILDKSVESKACKPYFSWHCQAVTPSTVLCSEWPAAEYREARSNHVISLMILIAKQIEDISKVYEYKKKAERLRIMLETIVMTSEKILSLAPLPYETKLEKARNTELKGILKRAKSDAERYLKEDNLPFEEVMSIMHNHVSSVLELVEENHPSFPNIEVAITKIPQNRKKTGFSLRAQDYLYSKNKAERGRNCGNIQTLFMCDTNGFEVGALEVFLWFGKESELTDCVEMLTGAPPQNEEEIQDITLTEVHYFELRVHVYQGRLNPGLDDSGLADAFVRVLSFGQCQETAVRAQTLDPIWDETLIFTPVRLNGKPHLIQKQSCGIVFEVLDYDGKDKVELVGRGVYRPRVTLAGDSYTPARLTRQPIHRCQEQTGEIIMTMELIERNEDSLEAVSPTKAYTIPDEIRPHMTAFNLDVTFWGVRNCKPSNCCPWSKLMGLIECNGTRLESPLVKFEMCANFAFSRQRATVLLPLTEEYTPALSVGLYEFKSFNKTSYKGGALLPSIHQFQKESRNESAGNFVLDMPKRKTEHSAELAEKPDWWSKYYASKVVQRSTRVIKIYKQELEFQPEFESFQDFLYPFHLTRGKTNEKKKARPEYIGTLKCCIALSPDRGSAALSPSSYFQNSRLDVTLRVYIIAAHNLAQTDINGRCDPYIALTFGSSKVSDRKNYIYKDTEPIFGKCFEVRGTLPCDHVLCVKVMDHDMCLTDNLVGETFIDIENRFFSKYRAACGLPDTYELEGFCKWRDSQEPVEILEQLCRINEITGPEFTDAGVKIGKNIIERDINENQNSLAHRILANLELVPSFGYKLVPEHVETRSLYHPMKPRLAQGKLEMWVDIFPGHGSLPPAVDVTPQPPEQLQLRVIVWNTAEVLSSDINILTMEESIDVYVVAWLTSTDDLQKTDIHYRSLTGEGMFNWRFIFPFLFSPSDQKMVIDRRAGIAEGFRKEKIPPKLELQVWDNDVLIDDFIGSLTLDLCNMPRGAQSAENCTLKMLQPDYPTVSLFKLKRIRGWWPFKTRGREKEEIAGKVELELEIVTKEQADISPVGLGREPPQPLPEPKRPATSSFFASMWGFNFMKILKRVAFGNIGRKLMIVAGILLVGAFVIAGWLAIPGILLNRWVNSSGYLV